MSITPWEEVEISGRSPTPRAAHSCNAIEDKLFLFGGWNGFEALNDFYVLFTSPEMRWKKITESENRPKQRNNHASSVYGNSLFIHGGHNGESWLNDMYEFTVKCGGNSDSLNLTGLDEISEELIGTWKKIKILNKGVKPSPRACHTLTRVFGKLYLFGGYDGGKCYNDLWVYDIAKVTWTEIEFGKYIPRHRNGHCAISSSKGIIFFGGHTGKEYIGDVSVFCTEKKEFHTPKVFGICPSARKGHSLAPLDDVSVAMFGGYDGKNRSDDLFILDISELPSTIRWERVIEKDSPSPRQRNSLTPIPGGKCFLFGGFDGSCWKSDAMILDLRKLSGSIYSKNFSLPMLSNLDSLVDNPDFSDIVFVLENGELLYAHKCILAAQSQYFKSMFRIGMVESESKEIHLEHVTKKDFKVLIRFLYTSYLDETDLQVLCNVMLLADSYNITALSDLCNKTIKQLVEVGNVCELIKIAHCCNNSQLVQFCVDFASNHVEYLIKSPEFSQLSSEFPKLALSISNTIISKLI
ncbi:putative kelch repeat protein [Cryptosporidium felis]|nr:putative kelch repeat protein [Cryptosporidium felis]